MVDMLVSPFMEAPLKAALDSVAEDSDCLFDSQDVYSDCGLLTPPWSPCDSLMDTGDDCDLTLTDTACGTAYLPATTTRPRWDSFLCSCTSCECSCLGRVQGPVLHDCMWSQTTGLLPITARPPSSEVAPTEAEPRPAAGGDGRPCCPAIAPVCSNHTDRCVDPRNVFPCQEAAVASRNSLGRCSMPTGTLTSCPSTSDYSSSSAQSSPVYDPDSETSAYCSAFSEDEFEEIDVVSVPSCSSSVGGWSVESNSMSLVEHPVRRSQVLVLPASESMSAQVAAMHNYSNPRCHRPASSPRNHALNSWTHTKCAVSPSASRGPPSRSRRRPSRRVHATMAASSPTSDWSSDGGGSGSSAAVGPGERHKRAQHNVMERQRRYHLKSHFYCLRDVVPGTRGDGRVSKVAILRRAVDFVRQLQSSHTELEKEYRRQQALAEKWKWKLSLISRESRCNAPVLCA